MRRISLLLATMVLSVLLASGVALAINKIQCESGEQCRGTDRPDLMKGNGKANLMYGFDGNDTLKGFGAGDQLFGDAGKDRLLGGPGGDALVGGLDADTLKGGDGAELYFYRQKNWGKDTITDPTANNLVSLQLTQSNGPLTTRLTSDPLLPEVTDAAGTNTINWDGNVVRDVSGHRGDDTITGNDNSNFIYDGEDFGTDTDNITGAGGDDEIDVRDGEGDDTVDCGGGTDRVFFDQGDLLSVAGDCERQNPPQQ